MTDESERTPSLTISTYLVGVVDRPPLRFPLILVVLQKTPQPSIHFLELGMLQPYEGQVLGNTTEEKKGGEREKEIRKKPVTCQDENPASPV